MSPELLERVPNAMRAKACVCMACVAAAQPAHEAEHQRE